MSDRANSGKDLFRLKRILLSILAFLYLTTSMGATIHLHYCMGKLISWGFVDRESQSCATCGMTKAKGQGSEIKAGKNCCKDEHKEFKTSTDQKVASSELYFTRFLNQVAGNLLSFNPTTHFNSGISVFPLSHAPPIPDYSAIFLLNRNFRL